MSSLIDRLPVECARKICYEKAILASNFLGREMNEPLSIDINISQSRQKNYSDNIRKIVVLDTIRGLAAFIVFCSHFFEGLIPYITEKIDGTPLFGILNGPAAVIVFFVISGFVLSLRPIQTQSWKSLVVISLKRWPRLAGPVLVCGIIFSALTYIGIFPSPGDIPPRLQTNTPVYLHWGSEWHNELFSNVVTEALFGTFFQGSSRHNPVLWTMHWEFFGSIAVFCLSSIILIKLKLAIKLFLFCTIWIFIGIYNPFLIAFPVGVLGAIVYVNHGNKLRISGRSAFWITLLSIFVLSWDVRVKVGIWAWTGIMSKWPRTSAWVTAQSFAAILLITVALYYPNAQRWLANKFGAFAGKISFPFYLVHLPILCSLSAWFYIIVIPYIAHPLSATALFLFSASVAVAVAYPLMIFDQWWVRTLERLAKSLVIRFPANSFGILETQSAKTPLIKGISAKQDTNSG